MSKKLTALPTGNAEGAVLYGVQGTEDIQIAAGAANGLATLDGSGKINSNQVPPMPRDLGGEVATEAEMLALVVNAPGECIRTDFTPPHVFYLAAEPATTLSNWHDLGPLSAGSANPTGKVGPSAVNGVASTFMRSDAAPALNTAVTYTWGALHTFSAGALISGGNLYFGATTGTTTPMLKASGDQFYAEVADGSRLTAFNGQAFLQGFLMPRSGGISSPEYTSFDHDKAGMTFTSDTSWSLVLNEIESLRVDTTNSNDKLLVLPTDMKIMWGTAGMGAPYTFGFMPGPDNGLLFMGDHLFAMKFMTSGEGGDSGYTFESGPALISDGDGVIRLLNSARTDFNRLQFGGHTNAFPALKRNGASLEARLADDSNPTTLIVATPTAASHAASKGYVDTGFRSIAAGNNLVYTTSATGTQITVPYVSNAATGNTIVERDASGCVVVNVPTAELHAVNKGYSDARTLSQAAKTAVLALTTIATADATDPASTMALVNACKAKINSIIDALKAS